MKHDIVSFDDEKLILVDKDDNVLGYKSKDECHLGNGDLHRAFSIFIFNENKEILLQKRSEQKQLWPLFWSNSCCSHPRKGEDYKTAIHRRLKEELGIDTALKYLYKFQYQVSYKNVGSEHELCSVYIGKSNEKILVNTNEISDWKFINTDVLDNELEKFPEKYTPWFKMEWNEIKKKYWNEVSDL